LTDIGGGAYKITVRADALQGLDCSAVPVNNTNVQMWNYVGNNRQQWILEPVAGGGAAINSTNVELSQVGSLSVLSLDYIAGEIKYNLPSSGFATLALFDLNGKKVADLVKREQSSGEHEATLISGNLPAGLYIIRLSFGAESKSIKIILN
jgi:hypothetical protein